MNIEYALHFRQEAIFCGATGVSSLSFLEYVHRELFYWCGEAILNPGEFVLKPSYKLTKNLPHSLFCFLSTSSAVQYFFAPPHQWHRRGSRNFK